MLDINNGTPDIQQKRYCEGVIKLLAELEGNSSSVGKVNLALVLADEETGTFNFSTESTKYGPRIDSFEEIIDVLVEHGFVNRDTVDGTNYIQLTQKPYNEFDVLSDEELRVLEWVASKHAKTSQIFAFMRLQYPEHFTEN